MTPSRRRRAGLVATAVAAAARAAASCSSRAPGVAEDTPPEVLWSSDAGGAQSAGGDAGSEAAPVDLGGGSTNAPAPDAGYALFDNFDDVAVGGPPNPAVWSVVEPDCSGTGTLAVDDSQAHSGHQSVRVDGGSGYCDHVFFSNASAISGLGSQVYARFFVRLGAALGQGHVTFLAMTDQNDPDDQQNAVRMGGQDMVLIYNRQSDDATLPTLSPTGVADTVAIVTATWTCIEFHIDQTAGTIDTWVNGTEVPGLVENGTPVADISTQWLSQAWRPKLVDFALGWESYAGQAMTLWFDDVALAGFRIGCGT